MQNATLTFRIDRHKSGKTLIMQRFEFLRRDCVVSENFQVHWITSRLQWSCYQALAALMPACSMGLSDNLGL